MREHELIQHNGHVLTLGAASRTAEAVGVSAGVVSALGTPKLNGSVANLTRNGELSTMAGGGADP